MAEVNNINNDILAANDRLAHHRNMMANMHQRANFIDAILGQYQHHMLALRNLTRANSVRQRYVSKKPRGFDLIHAELMVACQERYMATLEKARVKYALANEKLIVNMAFWGVQLVNQGHTLPPDLLVRPMKSELGVVTPGHHYYLNPWNCDSLGNLKKKTKKTNSDNDDDHDSSMESSTSSNSVSDDEDEDDTDSVLHEDIFQIVLEECDLPRLKDDGSSGPPPLVNRPRCRFWSSSSEENDSDNDDDVNDNDDDNSSLESDVAIFDMNGNAIHHLGNNNNNDNNNNGNNNDDPPPQQQQAQEQPNNANGNFLLDLEAVENVSARILRQGSATVNAMASNNNDGHGDNNNSDAAASAEESDDESSSGPPALLETRFQFCSSSDEEEDEEDEETAPIPQLALRPLVQPQPGANDNDDDDDDDDDSSSHPSLPELISRRRVWDFSSSDDDSDDEELRARRRGGVQRVRAVERAGNDDDDDDDSDDDDERNARRLRPLFHMNMNWEFRRRELLGFSSDDDDDDSDDEDNDVNNNNVIGNDDVFAPVDPITTRNNNHRMLVRDEERKLSQLKTEARKMEVKVEDLMLERVRLKAVLKRFVRLEKQGVETKQAT